MKYEHISGEQPNTSQEESIAQEQVESTEDVQEKFLVRLYEDTVEAEKALQSGDLFTAAQWVEGVRDSVRMTEDTNLLDAENRQLYDNWLKSYSEAIYNPEGTATVLEASKRDFFETNITPLLEKIDAELPLGKISPEDMNEYVQTLQTLTNESILKTLSPETAQALQTTLEVLSRHR